jgi:hypothetical protein
MSGNSSLRLLAMVLMARKRAPPGVPCRHDAWVSIVDSVTVAEASHLLFDDLHLFVGLAVIVIVVLTDRNDIGVWICLEHLSRTLR